MLTKDIIDELIYKLKEIFQDDLLSIILYGSLARKENTNESDVDIAIILKAPITTEQQKAFIKMSSAMDLRYDKVFSIVDIEMDQFEKWVEVLPFYKNIRDEGIVLWKAA